MSSCWPPLTLRTNTCTVVNETDDGHGVNLRSNHPIYSVNHDWATLEIIFIRFDTFFATNGSFPVYHEDERRGRVGYDAAVCVQKYEPWIIETYNTSFAPPSILRIVEKGNDNASPPAGSIRGPPIENTRYLNTTFGVAYGNGFAQMQKVEFEASPPYYPSPIVGPAVPCDEISSNHNPLHRLLLSPMGLTLRGTQNSTQTGWPLSTLGLVRLTRYHTLWDQDTSSHNRTRM